MNYFEEVCKIYRGEQTRLDLGLKTQSVIEDVSTSLLLPGSFVVVLILCLLYCCTENLC